MIFKNKINFELFMFGFKLNKVSFCWMLMEKINENLFCFQILETRGMRDENTV